LICLWNTKGCFANVLEPACDWRGLAGAWGAALLAQEDPRKTRACFACVFEPACGLRGSSGAQYMFKERSLLAAHRSLTHTLHAKRWYRGAFSVSSSSIWRCILCQKQFQSGNAAVWSWFSWGCRIRTAWAHHWLRQLVGSA